MDHVDALAPLRERVGLTGTRAALEAAGESGARIAPAVNGILAFPEEPQLLGPTAALCGLPPFHFSRVFKAVLGMGFYDFVERARVDDALVRLAQAHDSGDKGAEGLALRTATALELSLETHTGLPLLAVLALLRPAPAPED